MSNKVNECIDHGQRGDYGRTTVGGKFCMVHRAVYAKAHGLDVFGMGGVVMHSCDNPRCINLEHLSLADQKTNMADMAAKGRARNNPRRGTDSPAAKLTEADVFAIRKSTETHKVISATYGIGQTQVSRIKGGQSWKHLK